MVRSLALRLCGNRADADDLVQDTFLQAFRKWHTFRGEADPGTWLFMITLRLSHKRRKRASKRRTVAMSQLMPWSERTVMQLAASPDDTRESNPERREAVRRVEDAIALLPEHLRVPLVVKEVLQRSVEETSQLLGLAPNTVKTRVHRARLALRKAMTQRAAAIAAPAPIYEKQVCLDLLKAKMDALDRGGTRAGFTVPQADLCARCRAVFRELDLVQDACTQLRDDAMPAHLRRAILRAIAQRDEAGDATSAHAPRRGRRPVRTSRRTKANSSL